VFTARYGLGVEIYFRLILAFKLVNLLAQELFFF
jgi:hypothetical protein